MALKLYNVFDIPNDIRGIKLIKVKREDTFKAIEKIENYGYTVDRCNIINFFDGKDDYSVLLVKEFQDLKLPKLGFLVKSFMHNGGRDERVATLGNTLTSIIDIEKTEDRLKQLCKI